MCKGEKKKQREKFKIIPMDLILRDCLVGNDFPTVA